ncbi:hypothetical protein U0070_020018 [Myodes glareolus]|uniref:Uncharacterized protein n=1 Tax=Myodes glareolus TaxID=447135 RepID=A0AAW0HH65_MYOGA
MVTSHQGSCSPNGRAASSSVHASFGETKGLIHSLKMQESEKSPIILEWKALGSGGVEHALDMRIRIPSLAEPNRLSENDNAASSYGPLAPRGLTSSGLYSLEHISMQQDQEQELLSFAYGDVDADSLYKQSDTENRPLRREGNKTIPENREPSPPTMKSSHEVQLLHGTDSHTKQMLYDLLGVNAAKPLRAAGTGMGHFWYVSEWGKRRFDGVDGSLSVSLFGGLPSSCMPIRDHREANRSPRDLQHNVYIKFVNIPLVNFAIRKQKLAVESNIRIIHASEQTLAEELGTELGELNAQIDHVRTILLRGASLNSPNSLNSLNSDTHFMTLVLITLRADPQEMLERSAEGLLMNCRDSYVRSDVKVDTAKAWGVSSPEGPRGKAVETLTLPRDLRFQIHRLWSLGLENDRRRSSAGERFLSGYSPMVCADYRSSESVLSRTGQKHDSLGWAFDYQDRGPAAVAGGGHQGSWVGTRERAGWGISPTVTGREGGQSRLTQEEQRELEYLTGNFDWEAIFQAGTLVEELSSSEALVLSPSLSLPHMETWALLSMALLSGDLQ